MLALLFSTLFAAAAFLALGAIGSSWRTYGGAVRALHRALLECGRTRELRYRLVTTSAGDGAARPGARIYRVDFRPAGRNSLTRSPSQFGLRAAA